MATNVDSLAQQLQGLSQSQRAQLLQRLTPNSAPSSTWSDFFGFSQVGATGMEKLAGSVELLAGSLTTTNFKSIAHAVEHLVGMTFVRVAQPSVIPEERWHEVMWTLGQLHLCQGIESKLIPAAFFERTQRLATFLEELVDDKISGVIWENGQKEGLKVMQAYLQACEKEADGFEMIAKDTEGLPGDLALGEAILKKLYVRHVSLGGSMQRALRRTNPRLDAISLALAIMKQNRAFSQKDLEAVQRAQNAAAFLLADRGLVLEVGGDNLEPEWRAALARLRDMPLGAPYLFAKVNNPLTRADLLEIEAIFERVCSLNEGAFATTARRVRALALEVTALCVDLAVQRLAELPLRMTVVILKFYISIPFRLFYVARLLLNIK